MTNFTIPATDYRTTFFGSTGAEALTSGAHSVTVAAGGSLDVRPTSPAFVAAITGLGQTGPSNAVWTLTVNGVVSAASLNPSDMLIGAGLFNGFGTTANRVTVGVEGSLFGTDYGFASSARGAITNSGNINGQTAAIWFGDVGTLGTNGFAPANIGTNLIAKTGAANGAANQAIIDSTVSVTNAVTGEITVNTVDLQFGMARPSGVAIKNMGHTGLTITNSGTITGGGDSLYTGQTVQNSTAHDRNTNYDGAIYSAGKLTLNNAATGTITGSISTEWFGATITNAGYINGGIEMGLFTNLGLFDTNRDGEFGGTSGARGVAEVTTLSGLTVTNSGFIGTFTQKAEFSRPDNNSRDGFSVVGFNARDTVRNTGVISSDVYLQGGADLFANTGALASADDVFMGAGNDTVTNSGVVKSVWAQEGDDSVSNTLRISLVNMGDGNDTVTNSGTVDGMSSSSNFVCGVDMGAGNDVLTNSGTIGQVRITNAPPAPLAQSIAEEFTFITQNGGFREGSYPSNGTNDYGVRMGMGDDTLTSTGTVHGWIGMGAGNDVMTGGVNQDFIYEDDGRDRYSTGAGADRFFVDGSDQFSDTLDGGAGIDILILGDDHAFSVDLSANTLRNSNDTLAGNTDVVLNVEAVVGGFHADVIIGSARADSLAGSSGADTITGGGGKDMLHGGHNADVFVFNAASDSAVTRAGRDVVLDFVDFFSTNDDLIYLNFDANTGLAGTQQFDYAGIALGAFTREGVGAAARFNAGELRYTHEGGNTILRGDTNGDGRADFAIELRGILTLDRFDFVTII